MKDYSYIYHYYKQTEIFRVTERLIRAVNSGISLLPYRTSSQKIRNWNYPARYNLAKLTIERGSNDKHE